MNGLMMNLFHREIIRRLLVLLLLVLSAFFFSHSAKDLYLIKHNDYAKSYQDKVKWGWINPASTSLQAYIDKELKSANNVQEITSSEAVIFLQSLLEPNASLSAHRSLSTYEKGFYFNVYTLPTALIEGQKSNLKLVDDEGKAHYFKHYKADTSHFLRDAPYSLHYPLRPYAYVTLVLALMVYILIPRLNIPQGAASYAKANAIYVPDFLSYVFWSAGWLLFWFMGESVPVVVTFFLLLFFGVMALTLQTFIAKYASHWYLFDDNKLTFSDLNGVHTIAVEDAVSVQPYTKALPKWVGPLIILLGRGSLGPTGWGLIATTATPEVGMEITTKDQKIRIMANYLQSDTAFTESFQTFEKMVNAKKES
jgi:hypothetical protein